MSESPKKVIVGMSGGVDSSVSAWLLQQQGYQVEGLFMKNWEEDDGEEYCTAAADLADAQAVCDKLGIELHTVNFAARRTRIFCAIKKLSLKPSLSLPPKI